MILSRLNDGQLCASIDIFFADDFDEAPTGQVPEDFGLNAGQDDLNIPVFHLPGRN